MGSEGLELMTTTLDGLPLLICLRTALTINAERMEENLLPCDAAVWLQAGTRLQEIFWKLKRSGFMAKSTEFYVPSTFQKHPTK